MKKILFLGKDGLVGRNFIEQYCELYDIVGIGRKESGALEQILDQHGEFEAVMFAAQSGDYKSPHMTLDLFEVNIQLLFRTLGLVRDKTKRFVFFSTGSVYRQSSSIILEDAPLNLMSGNPYIASKLTGEELVRCFASYFDHTAILRPFFIYGKGQKPGMLMEQMKQRVRKGETIKLASGKGLVFNPIYAGDVAAYLARLMSSNSDDNMTVKNLCGEEVISLMDVINRLEEFLGLKANIEHTDQDPVRLVAGSASDIIGKTSFKAELLN